MKRLVLVTSRVNYVKDNYEYLLNNLLNHFRSEILAVVVVDNLEWKLLFKSIALYFMGCRKIGFILIRNFFRAALGRTHNFDVPVRRFKNINSKECIDFLTSLSPDVILNLRTRNIYKPEVLRLPKLGCINVHHGILPQYRGTMCDLWALDESRPVGFSVHWMNAKVDDGDILATYTHEGLSTRDYSEIPYLSSLQEFEVLKDILEKLARNEKPLTQANKCDTKIYSKNPNWKQIRDLKRKGIQL